MQNLDAAYAALQKVAPGTEMTTMIHVGNRPEQQVSYRGETLQQYFLVKYANPNIVPWVHTVMYFDLFEPALGAYGHAEFDAHRAFLLQRLRSGRPVGYFPEASYWVAFDSSVPLFLPLYLRSRHLDLARLAEEARTAQAPRLREHILFSSGWEWGYWLTDVSVLRMGWSLPERWSDPARWAFAPWGEKGQALAERIDALGEVQHRALMVQGLSPWLAGRDQILDYGRGQNIVSQPDRLEYLEISRLPPNARAAFDAQVVTPLEALAAQSEALAAEVEALGLDLEDPFLAEARDAFAITALRARWAHTAVRAARTFGDGEDVRPALEELDALLARARTVVSRRRDGMHDPDPKSLLRHNQNPSLYQYGYLREADTLCYWQRERAQLRNLTLQSGDVVPGCVL